MIPVARVLEALELIAPSRLAFSWDRIGLQIGSTTMDVAHGVTCLDCTLDLALSLEPKTVVISHHPIIWDPMKRVDTSAAQGRVIAELLKKDCVLIAAHTNWDCAEGGINDTLAAHVGLSGVSPFGPASDVPAPVGLIRSPIGRIGTLPDCISLRDYKVQIESALQGPTQAFGDPQSQIRTVAVIGGSGCEFWYEAQAAGADLLITGEVRHDHIVKASGSGFSIFVSGHYETEHPGMVEMSHRLSATHPELGWLCLHTNAGKAW